MRTILSGLRAWTTQRLTAIYLLLFLLFAIVVRMAWPSPTSYAQWRAWVTSGAVRPAMMLFFASLLLHAWVGLRDVVLDYARPRPVRVAALALVAFGLAALGAWTLEILINA